jgi:hypothetical protein
MFNCMEEARTNEVLLVKLGAPPSVHPKDTDMERWVLFQQSLNIDMPRWDKDVFVG